MANIFSNLFKNNQQEPVSTQQKESKPFYLDPNYDFLDEESLEVKIDEEWPAEVVREWAVNYVKNQQFDKSPADRFPKFCAHLASHHSYFDLDYVNNEFCAQTGFSLSSKDKAIIQLPTVKTVGLTTLNCSQSLTE